MRIEVAQQTGHPVPQFVVHAESASDRAILGMFTDYGRHAKKPVRFWLHGCTYSCDMHGVTAFNFGYIYEDAFKRHRWWQFWKGFWRR